MEQGLAHQMTYGKGSRQIVKHYYAGAKKDKNKCNCGKKRKTLCKGGCNK